ncbi:MAG: ATP-binding protein [Anaerolineae bacterium]
MDVEFKSEGTRPLSDGDLVEAVVCLSNRPGDEPGYLLIGVTDDGRITGARPRHGDRTDPLRVHSLIAGKTRPSTSTRVSVVPVDGFDVVIIEVPVARSPVGTADGRYLRRAIAGDGRPACLPMHFHEMQSLQADRGQQDYSSLVVPDATWDDLDPLELERFRRFVRESEGRGDGAMLTLPDLELAKALGAVAANHVVQGVRVLGLLLFGREAALRRFLPTHEVAFQALSGQRVEVNDFFRWPLLRVFDELLARFRARNREAEISVGMLRIGVPDYPLAAFREGAANALIHRDYSQLGAVHVQWHDDHIEIANPGGFPEGVRLDNLLVTPPRPRNPLLADALKRAGLVERTARGIDTIFYEQLRNGRPAPSYARSTESNVVLVLPGGAASLAFVTLVAEEGQANRLLSLDELLLLNGLWNERRLTTAEGAALIQKPEAEARIRLQRLVEAGLVQPHGQTKARSWHLSGATYRRLGDPAAFVHQRGFEPIQQANMVLQFAAEHGRITRSEAADLCHLEPRQAGALLRRLVAAGSLRPQGERGGRWYAPMS